MIKIGKTIIWCGATCKMTWRAAVASLAGRGGSTTSTPRSRGQTGQWRSSGCSLSSGTSKMKSGVWYRKSWLGGPIIRSKIIGTQGYVSEYRICRRHTTSISKGKRNRGWFSAWWVPTRTTKKNYRLSRGRLVSSWRARWTRSRSLT